MVNQVVIVIVVDQQTLLIILVEVYFFILRLLKLPCILLRRIGPNDCNGASAIKVKLGLILVSHRPVSVLISVIHVLIVLCFILLLSHYFLVTKSVHVGRLRIKSICCITVIHGSILLE